MGVFPILTHEDESILRFNDVFRVVTGVSIIKPLI